MDQIPDSHVTTWCELWRAEVELEQNKLCAPVSVYEGKLDHAKMSKEAVKKIYTRSTPCFDQEPEQIASWMVRLMGLDGFDDLNGTFDKYDIEATATDKQKLMRVFRKHTASNERDKKFDFKMQGGDEALLSLVSRRPDGIPVEDLLSEFCAAYQTPETWVKKKKRSEADYVTELSSTLKESSFRYIVSKDHSEWVVRSTAKQPADTTNAIPELYFKEHGLDGWMHCRTSKTAQTQPYNARKMQQLGYKIVKTTSDQYIVRAPALLSGEIHPGCLSSAAEGDSAVVQKHFEILQTGIPQMPDVPTWLSFVISVVNKGKKDLNGIVEQGEFREVKIGAAVVGVVLTRAIPQMVRHEEKQGMVSFVCNREIPETVRNALTLPKCSISNSNIMKLIFAGIYFTTDDLAKPGGECEAFIRHLLCLDCVKPSRYWPPQTTTFNLSERFPVATSGTHKQTAQFRIPEENLHVVYGLMSESIGYNAIYELLPSTVLPFAFTMPVPKTFSGRNCVPGWVTFSDLDLNKFKLETCTETPVVRAVQKILRSLHADAECYVLPDKGSMSKVVFTKIPIAVDQAAELINIIVQKLTAWVVSEAKFSGFNFCKDAAISKDAYAPICSLINPIKGETLLPYSRLGQRPSGEWATIHHLSNTGESLPVVHGPDLIGELSLRRYYNLEPSQAWSLQ